MIFWGGFPLQYSRSQPRPLRGRHRGSKSKHAIRCFLARKKRIKRQQGQHVTTKHRQSTHAVIAEARAHTRYGTGSVVAVGYPRSPHIAVIPTPAGSHICSSGSCGGKALAHVFAATACKNCDSANEYTIYTAGAD